MQENDDFRMEDDESVPPPIKRSSNGVKKSGPMFTTVTLIILLVAIIGAGVYLLYRYKVFAHKPGVTSQPAEQPPLTNPWKSDQPQPSTAASGTALSAEGTAPAKAAPAVADGKFAVYIDSYRERADAEEEVNRWVAAGFASFVDDASGWHRVAFGRFNDEKAAGDEASRWKTAFENGFWIGPVN